MGGHTVDIDLICCALNAVFAVMYHSRGINEVNHVRVAGAGSELQGKEVFVEAHDLRMEGMRMNGALNVSRAGSHHLSRLPAEAVSKQPRQGPRGASGNKIVCSVA